MLDIREIALLMERRGTPLTVLSGGSVRPMRIESVIRIPNDFVKYRGFRIPRYESKVEFCQRVLGETAVGKRIGKAGGSISYFLEAKGGLAYLRLREELVVEACKRIGRPYEPIEFKEPEQPQPRPKPEPRPKMPSEPHEWEGHIDRIEEAHSPEDEPVWELGDDY